ICSLKSFTALPVGARTETWTPYVAASYFSGAFMRFPLSLTTDMAGYMIKKKLGRERKFPLVLMLEPLHACNLTCTGCGRIREYETTIKQKLSVEECVAASEECAAPVVSIC